MDVDKQIEGLENEFKLLKGELKETLMGVRDLLDGMEVPRFESRTRPAVEASPLKQIPVEQPAKFQETPLADAAPLQDILVEDAAPLQDVPLADAAPLQEMSLEEPSAFQEVDIALPNTVSELPEELSELPYQPPELGKLEEAKDEASCERSTEEKMRGEEEGPTATQVNLLANLIRWVSCAKKEIGDELLPAFLDVYGVGGYLPDELKQCILHLVPVVEQQSAKLDAASVWGRLTLELRGILAGGGAPPHPLRLSWNGDEEGKTEPDGTEGEAGGPEEGPIRLKLAVPVGDGMEKEYSVVLTPEADRGRSQGAPPSPEGDSKKAGVS